jgi:hypothetical protein
MDTQEIQGKSSTKSPLRNSFFNWIAPTILLISTVITTIFAGGLLSGEEGYLSATFIIRGLPFAFAILFIMSSHAFGHYLMARLNSIGAYFPYFVPKLGMAGTAGAYTKMQWPISDRNSLLRIFTIGPISGFCASLLMLIIGLAMSQVIERVELEEYSITLGNSLITLFMNRIIHGQLPDNRDIVLHPVAFAGWMGLHYNFWHLLPIGKLDGGRIVYALRGYKWTKRISYFSIIILIVLGFLESGWIAMAIFGVICMIRFREQYPSDKYDGEIQKSQFYLCLISLIIFIVSFAPIPIHFEGI